jgi:protein-disulfide isomerase
VQRDLDEGKRLGITGTPAFFVNGRPLSGAQPLEAFVRVIEDELARMAARKVSE